MTITTIQQTNTTAAERLAALHERRLIVETALKNLPGRDAGAISQALDEDPAEMLQQLRLVAEAKNLERVYRDALAQIRARIERAALLVNQ